MNFLNFCGDCCETFATVGSPAIVCSSCQGEYLDLLLISQNPIQIPDFGEFDDHEEPSDTSEIILGFLNELSQLHPAESAFGKVEESQLIVIDQSHVDRGLECVICMSNNEVGEKVRQLHCFHMFHEDCLRGWLEEHFTCPLCRNPVGNDGFV